MQGQIAGVELPRSPPLWGGQVSTAQAGAPAAPPYPMNVWRNSRLSRGPARRLPLRLVRTRESMLNTLKFYKEENVSPRNVFPFHYCAKP